MDKARIIGLIDAVRDIAYAAGEEILDVYKDEASFGVEAKADDSPLTLADQRANKVICDSLIALNADIPIISEENKAIDFSERKDFEYFWMVDPLDGTKEFIKRNGEFTVNIALIHKNRSIAGVVYVPVTDEMYWAVKGEGAWKMAEGSKERLVANNYSMDDEGLGVVCSRSHLNEETSAFLNGLKNPETVSKGSSLKFLIIAESNADVYPRLAPTMEWDTAAAHIILEEAGGQVVRADDHTPLIYNKENLTNPHFIAYGVVNK